MESISESSAFETRPRMPSMSIIGESPSCDHDDEWIPLAALGAGADTFGEMIVQSPQMRNLVRSVISIAPHKATVLIQGESGTGKELIAQALHKLGPMPNGPFVIFNCSNLIGPLAEAQLFGHVRGAFTDAREDSLGYFRSANKGTLFLDEVGELPLQLQPKLLRVLETYEVQAVGSTKNYKTDLRIVAATNRDLRAMVKAGEFREDLYHRLNAVSLHIPPLRERTEGKGALIARFIERSNKLFDKRVEMISRRAVDLIESHSWSGNVRELANTLQSAVMLTARDRLCVLDFPHVTYDLSSIPGHSAKKPKDELFPQHSRDIVLSSGMGSTSSDRRHDAAAPPVPLREAANRERKKALIRALSETGWNCSQTARLLGVSRFTVYRLMERFGLTRSTITEEN